MCSCKQTAYLGPIAEAQQSEMARCIVFQCPKPGIAYRVRNTSIKEPSVLVSMSCCYGMKIPGCDSSRGTEVLEGPHARVYSFSAFPLEMYVSACFTRAGSNHQSKSKRQR